MANDDNSRPKAIYIVYLDENEVRTLLDIRDNYGVGQSILDKVEAGSYPKGANDPINRLFAWYKEVEKQECLSATYKHLTSSTPEHIAQFHPKLVDKTFGEANG